MTVRKNGNGTSEKDSKKCNRFRGVRPETEAKYRQAIELYRSTDLSCAEISRMCGLTKNELRGYIFRYHRDLMLARNNSLYNQTKSASRTIACFPNQIQGGNRSLRKHGRGTSRGLVASQEIQSGYQGKIHRSYPSAERKRITDSSGRCRVRIIPRDLPLLLIQVDTQILVALGTVGTRIANGGIIIQV